MRTLYKLLCQDLLYKFHPLQPGVVSIAPENIRNFLGFLMISGGIEKQNRAVMG